MTSNKKLLDDTPLIIVACKDRLGVNIKFGDVVHWTDGGDDLPLDERISTRWDRIAVVVKGDCLPVFKVIDSPSDSTRTFGAYFNFGSFIYKDTEKYLTIVASSVEDYREKFSNAGECMAYVLEVNNAAPRSAVDELLNGEKQ